MFCFNFILKIDVIFRQDKPFFEASDRDEARKCPKKSKHHSRRLCLQCLGHCLMLILKKSTANSEPNFCTERPALSTYCRPLKLASKGSIWISPVILGTAVRAA